MARQDLNEAFAQTAFLYGGNATYIEDLYAQYARGPELGRCRVEGVFRRAQGRRSGRREERRRRLVGEAELADRGERRTRRGARRRLGLDRGGDRRQDQGQGADEGRRDFAKGDFTGDARQRARAHADPRLSGARPFARQPRSAGARGARRPRGTAPVALRVLGRRLRSPDLPRQRARPRIRHHPRHCRRSWSARIARRSASSSCTSPIRPRRRGFRSASKGRTRRSRSPRRVGGRSSTSSSRRKVSRSSST